ncbi:hypothetical protein [Aliarcobacter butzleri]|uniref:hypothetical protein n=1 Tax=Aliarcobacter butzleri TaxID=28197 RepID=UPI002B240FC8|nr:hypothetical protein [Aliarcobacter butzleri]
MEKAKLLYKPIDGNSLLGLYSLEMKKLIDEKVVPNENSSINSFKKAYEIYKTKNEKDSFVEEFISSWKNQNDIIKFSFDKKYRVIQYHSDII